MAAPSSLSSTQTYKAAQIAMIKEREKGAKGGSCRPANGINTKGRRSTMGQGRSARRREDIHNDKSSMVLTAKAAQREHDKKNRAAEEKKMARRAARALDLDMQKELDQKQGSAEGEEGDTLDSEGPVSAAEAEAECQPSALCDDLPEPHSRPGTKQRSKDARKRLLEDSFRVLAVTDVPRGRIQETVFKSV